MFKIKSKNPLMKDRVIILPIVGKIQYDEDCIFEVSDESQAKEIVSIVELNLEIVGKGKQTTNIPSSNNDNNTQDSKQELQQLKLMTEKELNDFFKQTKRGDVDVLALNLGIENVKDLPNKKEVVNKILNVLLENEEEEVDESILKEDQIDFINSLSKIKELKELAVGFPEKEWNTIKSIAQFKEYLINKI